MLFDYLKMCQDRKSSLDNPDRKGSLDNLRKEGRLCSCWCQVVNWSAVGVRQLMELQLFIINIYKTLLRVGVKFCCDGRVGRSPGCVVYRTVNLLRNALRNIRKKIPPKWRNINIYLSYIILISSQAHLTLMQPEIAIRSEFTNRIILFLIHISNINS